MKFLLIPICCLSLATSTLAGDLNAPGAKVVTVKTEISRGLQATDGLSPFRNVLAYDEATRRIDDANTQRGTDSPGFRIGFHLAMWRELWMGLSEGVYKQPAERQLAAVLARTNYKIYLAQRAAQDLTPAQITECVGSYHGQADDEAWARADASQQFAGTYPEAKVARQ